MISSAGVTFKSTGKGASKASQLDGAKQAQMGVLRALVNQYIEVWWPLDEVWYKCKVLGLAESEPGGAEDQPRHGSQVAAVNGDQLRHDVVYIVDHERETINLCPHGEVWRLATYLLAYSLTYLLAHLLT